MNYCANNIVLAIQRARSAGLRPTRVLLDRSMLSEAETEGSKVRISASQLFGIPVESSDGFAVLSDGCLAVWNEGD